MSSLVDSLHQHTGLYDGDCGSGGHCDTVDAQSPGTDTSDRTFCATRRSSCCRRCRRVCGSVMTLAEGLRPCGGASRRGCDLAAVPRGGGHDLAARLRPRGEAATSRRGCDLAARLRPRGGASRRYLAAGKRPCGGSHNSLRDAETPPRVGVSPATGTGGFRTNPPWDYFPSPGWFVHPSPSQTKRGTTSRRRSTSPGGPRRGGAPAGARPRWAPRACRPPGKIPPRVPRGGEMTLRRELQLPPRRGNAAASRRIPRHAVQSSRVRARAAEVAQPANSTQTATGALIAG
jgi:hypothetical protein